jgi:anti-sigma factor RsiW
VSEAPSACQPVLENISAYLDGELEATACDLIQRHCGTCASCAALVAGLRETVGLCRDAGTRELPDAVRRRAQESVRRLLQREPD